MSLNISSFVDISQIKLYEKLTLLEKYCIKLEKRISELEDCIETLSKTPKKNTKINTKLTSDQIIQSAKTKTNIKLTSDQIIHSARTNISTNTKNINPSRKAKKIFDKYNMNRTT